MPELPEVEVVRSGLANHVLGAEIDDVEVLDPRSVRRHVGSPADFADALVGLRIRDVCRRGKYMWLRLAPSEGSDQETTQVLGSPALVIHLGMSGQALLSSTDVPDPRHLRIRMPLTAADAEPIELRFVDQRIFGGMYTDPVVDVSDAAGRPVDGASSSVLGLPEIPATVSHIARDPLDVHFDSAAFRRRLRATSRGIKRILLDQSTISGIGNIYADEALWRAGLHYAKPARRLTKPQAEELLAACTDVMTAALAEGGTSFDALYVNVNGESGTSQKYLNVYGRGGHSCKRCGTPIVRERFMNRSSHFCPSCQRKR